jgi:hypothetical protein
MDAEYEAKANGWVQKVHRSAPLSFFGTHCPRGFSIL